MPIARQYWEGGGGGEQYVFLCEWPVISENMYRICRKSLGRSFGRVIGSASELALG
jgi:hypothetical protein